LNYRHGLGELCIYEQNRTVKYKGNWNINRKHGDFEVSIKENRNFQENIQNNKYQYDV